MNAGEMLVHKLVLELDEQCKSNIGNELHRPGPQREALPANLCLVSDTNTDKGKVPEQ